MVKIVLVNPQIPPNTGNIARTCAATGTELHLVGPLGFEMTDRYLKRAGLDYWEYVKLQYHQSFADFLKVKERIGGNLVGFSVRGEENYIKYEFRANDWLLFGSETTGLPELALSNCDRLVYIKMTETGVRSLNLSVSVAVGLFEARRQLGYME